MKLIEHIKNRTAYERAFHAIMYEFVGIITSAPIISFITGKKLGESGVLAIIVSITAMIWNYIFNYIFDKVMARLQLEKTLLIRIIHGTIFEVGLVFLTVPIIALIMKMGLWDAFMLEIAMLIYFFPYTIVFNWIYDKLRFHYIKTHS